jgi:hypothetical protein
MKSSIANRAVNHPAEIVATPRFSQPPVSIHRVRALVSSSSVIVVKNIVKHNVAVKHESEIEKVVGKNEKGKKGKRPDPALLGRTALCTRTTVSTVVG